MCDLVGLPRDAATGGREVVCGVTGCCAGGRGHEELSREPGSTVSRV